MQYYAPFLPLTKLLNKIYAQNWGKHAFELCYVMNRIVNCINTSDCDLTRWMLTFGLSRTIDITAGELVF